MAPPADLREWIALLEREGELVRVAAEVDPHLEVTEIVDRTVKAGGPALLFERAARKRARAALNQFGSERRMCLAFGVELARRGRATGSPTCSRCSRPPGSSTKLRGLRQLKSIADSQPRSVRRGACQEVVLRGEEVDLGLLPVQTCWPGDAAPFITLPAVITARPAQRAAQRRHVPHAGARPALDGDALAAAQGRPRRLRSPRGGRMEVAVALGLDPVTAYSASAPLPKHIDELMFAGFLRGEAVELVAGRQRRPRGAGERRDRARGLRRARRPRRARGPSATTPASTPRAEPFPVFHLTAMTMRRGAIYPSIVVGKPPQEDACLGKATERIFLPAIRATVPEIVDYDLPVAGAFHNCAIVSIRKAYPAQAHKVMHAIWGLGLLSLTKVVVVVDAHVDPHDYAQVAFYVGANVDPARDLVLGRGARPTTSTTRRRASSSAASSASTRPRRGPPRGRGEWPPEIEMDAETRALVDRRWGEYGL